MTHYYEGYDVRNVFMVISKAFDKVWHKRSVVAIVSVWHIWYPIKHIIQFLVQ